MRRIEAVTGANALATVAADAECLAAIGQLVRASGDETLRKIDQVLTRNKTLEKELAEARRQLATGGSTDLTAGAVEVGDIRVLATRLDGVDAKSLRDAVDQLKDKLGERSVVVLGAEDDGKVRLAAGVSKALIKQLQAGALVKHVAEGVGGKGGGRPDFAQAGGTEPENLDKSLASVVDWVRGQVG